MQWHFEPFRLDLVNAMLWRAEQPVTLRPKTFEVLVYLVTHAGQLVDVLPGMNAGASTHAVPSPIEGSGTAWVLLGSWALSPARPTPIHPRRERRGLPALLVMDGRAPPGLQHANPLTDSYPATRGLCHPPVGETLWSTSRGPQLPGS
jgi:hypothetical protein